jgi:protease-4
LIYLNGVIVTGYGDTGTACGGDIRAALKKAMDDDSIKAVVLRVNTPGGSVTASEIIHQAVMDVQKKKPLVISMGRVAASGGYYVSCGANQIFADETTITASIGVIGSKLVTEGFWEKIGVNWVPFQRGANADLFSPLHPFTDQQRNTLITSMGTMYGKFKGHIVEGRGQKLTKDIEEIAGGRVFTGKQAVDLGLVDQIGGLQAAIEYAAKSVSLEKYKVRVVPKPKDAVDILLDVIFGRTEKANSDLETEAKTDLKTIETVLGKSSNMREIAGLLGEVDRPHANAIVEMLHRVQLTNQEGTAMIMPQILAFP